MTNGIYESNSAFPHLVNQSILHHFEQVVRRIIKRVISETLGREHGEPSPALILRSP